jgi:SAM-dependent methyltransferase
VPGYDRYAKFAAEAARSASPLDYLAGEDLAYWAVRERLRKRGRDAGARILEVGCGLGYLTYALNRHGYNATGLDISENAIKAATERFGNHYVCSDVRQYADSHAGKFDAVVLTEVIEHVSDPGPWLATCLRLLAPGGELIVSTPNREAWANNVPWEVEAPPVHLWWFSRRSFQVMAAKLNCALCFVDLRDAPGARTWHRWSIDEVELLGRCPLLDKNGEVDLKPPPVLVRRSLQFRVRRRARSAIRGMLGRLRRGPSPRICAVMSLSE